MEPIGRELYIIPGPFQTLVRFRTDARFAGPILQTNLTFRRTFNPPKKALQTSLSIETQTYNFKGLIRLSSFQTNTEKISRFQNTQTTYEFYIMKTCSKPPEHS